MASTLQGCISIDGDPDTVFSTPAIVTFIYSPIFDGSTNKIILAQLKDSFSRILKDGDYLCVLDSCDGLLLILCHYSDDPQNRLVVCNPLMRSFKFLQLPPPPSNDYNVAMNCYWKMVYDASIKRYKIIGITREKVITSMKDEVIISRGRRVYILELSKSSSESSEWKEVCVCDDELGGGDFGGQVKESVLVDDKGKKKLYFLTCNYRSPGDELRTSLIYIDIDSHQVKAVEAAACSSMSQGRDFWVGASSTGKFYMSDPHHGWTKFYLFVLEDFHNPIWKRQLINRRNMFKAGGFINLLAIVHDDGDDEEEKILYQVNGMIYEYHIGRGQQRLVWNNSRHYFIDFNHYHYPGELSVPHLHSMIII